MTQSVAPGKTTDTPEVREVVSAQERYMWRTGSEVTTINEAAIWYLSVCQSQRRSDNTVKAYRNNINRIGDILADLTDEPVDRLPLSLLNKNDLADGFNTYAATHAATSQAQCWAVWNQMCQLLVDHEVLQRNPMKYVVSSTRGTPNTVPRALPRQAVNALLKTMASPEPPSMRPNRLRWREMDYAMIVLFLATGIRESELCGLNLGDLAAPFDDDRARTVVVRGKGGRERTMVIEAPVVEAVENYLHTRWVRLPHTGVPADSVWDHWGPGEPLFVKHDGTRIKRRTVYEKVKRAYREAGITGYQSQGALVHQLRHTFATMLADDPNVTTYQLKNLLGHQSLNTTERYTSGAGRATRSAGQRNPIYQMVGDA